jgi:hypothetical protein
VNKTTKATKTLKKNPGFQIPDVHRPFPPIDINKKKQKYK